MNCLRTNSADFILLANTAEHSLHFRKYCKVVFYSLHFFYYSWIALGYVKSLKMVVT